MSLPLLILILILMSLDTTLVLLSAWISTHGGTYGSTQESQEKAVPFFVIVKEQFPKFTTTGNREKRKEAGSKVIT